MTRFERGDLEGAFTAASQALKLAPELFTGWANRGVIRGRRGELDAGIEDCTHAIALSPEYHRGWLNRSALRGMKGDSAGAIADARKAIEMKPRDAMSWCNLALGQWGMGEKKEALASFTTSLDCDPKLRQALHGRAGLRKEMGDVEGAVLDYSAMLKIEEDTDTYLNRAALLLDHAATMEAAGRPKEAEEERAMVLSDCTKALKLKQDLWQAWYNRGVARESKGDWDGVISDLTQAIKFNPKSVDAFLHRAEAHNARRDLMTKAGKSGMEEANAAILDWEGALKLQPGNLIALVNRANLYITYREFDKAIADSETAMKAHPGSAEPWGVRGMAKANKGDKKGAKADYEKALQLAPREWNHRALMEKLLKEVE